MRRLDCLARVRARSPSDRRAALLCAGLLWEAVLQPLGFVLEAASRVPYMSDGDTRCPVYVLDDALLVLSAPHEQAAVDSGDAAEQPESLEDEFRRSIAQAVI